MRDSRFKSRENLIEASLDEFCEINYENASLNRIIKNAGVSKGSFYYQFENKEDLYGHLLKQSVEAKWSYIKAYTKEHSSDFDKMDIFDKFLFQADGCIRFADENPRYSKLANMFVKEKGTPIYRAMIEAIGGESNEILNQMIDEAYANGEFDQSFDKAFLHRLLVNLFANYDDIVRNTGDLKDNLNNLKEFVRFMKNGVMAKK